MKPAPIQVSQISFRRISVEVDAVRISDGGSPTSDVAFDFEKVTIATHVSFSPVEEADAPGSSFFLILRVVIDNQVSDEKDARFSPYLVDIEAGAVVRAMPGSEKLGDVEDIVVVNGTSLLWSAIREQVCNLTARMPAGLVMLPTVNFHDLKRQQREGGLPPPALLAEKRKTHARVAKTRKASPPQE